MKVSPKKFFATFRFSPQALLLVWQTSPQLMLVLGILTVVAGLLPAGIAYTGKLLVDAVVAAIESSGDRWTALFYVGLEGLLVILLLAAQRGLELCQSLLRALLGQKVNVMILEKSLRMSLPQFEDSEFYDKLVRARREASVRPLSVVIRVFGILQNGISLISYCAILFTFSPWAVLLLALAALPSFIAETGFSGEAFRLFSWRSHEKRLQNYLEIMLTREDFAKEVQLYGLGSLFLKRYQDIFDQLFGEDRNLAYRRSFWGFVFGVFSTLALYGAYAWTVLSAIAKRISLGDMTMFLLVFKQGQASFSGILNAIGGMYEDNLYLSTLYEFLGQPDFIPVGTAISGLLPEDGLRFECVSFRYPQHKELVLDSISFHLKPGSKLALVGENGAGKTTLIKLLTRLYEPESGRILLDGRNIQEWDLQALRSRIGVIFQDFARYQMRVGENIGVGDVAYFDERSHWEEAAVRGMADDFINQLPDGYQTQLGRWFKDGQELSGGQWQRIALSRAFMRGQARILVLDEPTSAMDAEAEAHIFERFRDMAEKQMAILISHRFSTVRMADWIIVLEKGHIREQGSHDELMTLGGKYAHLFNLQAQGYQ